MSKSSRLYKDANVGLLADMSNFKVRGSGGGKKKGGGGSSATTTPDSLFSTAVLRSVDVLGEGELEVVGGMKGVYLNDVPIQNDDGTFNFKGVSCEFREGLPDQPYMSGYPDIQRTIPLGTQVKQATPVVVSIPDSDIDRVRVTLYVPALFAARDNGSTYANSVAYIIEARYPGGPWVNQLGVITIYGKTTSGYFRQHEIDAPKNSSGPSSPLQVRVTRLSGDMDGEASWNSRLTVQGETYIQSMTAITDSKFTYPHTASVGVTVNASTFGESSVPSRIYRVRRPRLKIPSNYDPVANTYTGIWDGTFTYGPSSNPAWVLYTILEDDRFGLGQFIDASAIDKWSLYEIGRYCDQLVPDGNGGMERRFAFNGCISDEQEAYELLQLVSQVFRGMTYWSSGTVTATQDRPSDPVMLVTESNVVDGLLNYSASGRRARHTVAMVTWNDPTNLFKQEIEVVEDSEGIARYGYNATKIDLLGCTSRGQAHRTGKWALLTGLRETQILTYRAGMDHATLRPGDIISVQDPQISNLEWSGRLLDGSTSTVLKLDRKVALTGTGHSISVTMPNGSISERAFTYADVNDLTVLTLGSPLTVGGTNTAPDKAAVWLIAATIKPQNFRVVAVREIEPHLFEVSALQQQSSKYAAVDELEDFVEDTISEFPKIVAKPIDLTAREVVYPDDLGQFKQSLTLSWNTEQPFNNIAYAVSAIRPDGTLLSLPERRGFSADFIDVEIGEWKFFVSARGLDGSYSEPAQLTYVVKGWEDAPIPTVTGLTNLSGGLTFASRDCEIKWDYQFPAEFNPYSLSAVVRVYDTSTGGVVHREELPVNRKTWSYTFDRNKAEGGPRRSFRVSVAALDPGGREGAPTNAVFTNDVPPLLSVVTTPTVLNINFQYTPPGDTDFAGVMVHQGTTPGFVPDDTNIVYDGPNTSIFVPLATGQTRYFKIAGYDTFGKSGLNYTATISATPLLITGVNLADNIISGAKLGAGIIDATKLASDIQAIKVFTTAPSTYQGDYATVGTPGALFRWNGTSYVNVNAAAQIVGSITDAQIANLNAAKLAGQISNTQISDNAITTPKLAAGSVIASVLAANSVTAAALAVSDPSNIVINGQFWNAVTNTVSADGWSLSNGVILEDLSGTNDPGGKGRLQDPTPSNYVAATSKWFNCNPGDSFYMSCMSWTNRNFVSGAAFIVITWQDNTGYNIGNQFFVGTSKNTWMKIDGRSNAAPANTARAIVQLGCTTATTGIVHFGRVEVRRSNTTLMIVEGAINADHLQTGSVTTDKIVANAIVTSKIAASAIKADQIDVAAITADKLAVGLNQNMAFNADFMAGPAIQISSGSTSGATPSQMICLSPGDHSDTYTPRGMRTMWIYHAPGNEMASGAVTDHYIDFPVNNVNGTSWASFYPCVPGKRYEFGAYFSAHACKGSTYIFFVDANGDSLGGNSSSVIENNSAPMRSLDPALRSYGFATAPAGAVGIRFTVRKTGTGAACHLFYTGLMLAPCGDNQTTPSNWAPSGGTIIDGSMIRTHSVKATNIEAATITGNEIAALTISANHIVVGSITGDRIQANSITADKLSVTSLAAVSANIGNLIVSSGGITFPASSNGYIVFYDNT